MSAEKLIVSLVTAPSPEVAEKLALSLLSARLCACVNIVPGIRSLYWWEGKVESQTEQLLLIKSRKSQIEEIQSLVQREHPYDTPEVVSLKATAVSEKYLDWVLNETKR
jgi:periplasmic divalent cation tolerance protein